MADEATVTCGLVINADNLQYRSIPNSYRADITGRKGPTPGAVTVTTTGTAIDLTQLTTPGLCILKNLDDTNYVEYGIYDTSSSTFFPLGELLAGEITVFRFSRNVTEEYVGTGTGTGNSFYMKANTASVVVDISAFEK